MLTATPVKYEIYDGVTLQAVIDMFDEGASTVEIKTLHNPESWIELSNAIHDALLKMHPVP